MRWRSRASAIATGPRKALDNVSFAVAAGDFTALLGLNGAGKSTLFSIVTRLFGMQAGRIRIFGHDIQREPGEALRRMGVVFQPRTLDLDLSVTQNLFYHAALHGIDRHDARMRVGRSACRAWALLTGSAAKYVISPAGKCGDWKLRGHSCIVHVSYCSMRRRSGWTSRREPRSSATCRGSSSSKA